MKLRTLSLRTCILLFVLNLNACSDTSKKGFEGIYKNQHEQLISIATFDPGPLGSQNGEMMGYYDFGTNRLGFLQTSDSLRFNYGVSWMNPDSVDGNIQFTEAKTELEMNGINYEWVNNFDTHMVHFTNDELTFEGELITPYGTEDNTPLVILIQGSGNGGRNYLYYQSLAHYLAYHGIASFRYDKRGTGNTRGRHEEIPFEKLASDVNAAIDAIQKNSGSNFSKTGVWGLSQGGWIGPLAASMNADIDFAIMVSAPTTTPGEQSLYSRGNELKDMGLPDSMVEEVKSFLSAYWEYLRSAEGYEGIVEIVEASKPKPWFNAVKQQLPYQIDPVPLPEWVRENQDEPILYWVTKEAVYEPLPILKELNIPMLAIYGAKDKIVPVQRSMNVLNEAVSSKNLLTTKVFENGNHILMTAQTGGMQEFPGLQKLEDGYFELIKDWIKEQKK